MYEQKPLREKIRLRDEFALIRKIGDQLIYTSVRLARNYKTSCDFLSIFRRTILKKEYGNFVQRENEPYSIGTSIFYSTK